MLKENSLKVFNYLKEHNGENKIAQDVADALELNVRSVNGTVTALAKKELVERIPAEIELADGTHKAVKIIKLTEKGMSFDPTAEETAE